MPERTDGEGQHLHLLSKEERLAMDGKFQAAWYEHLACILSPRDSLLDVGAGSGYGLDIIREHSFLEQEVVGCDLLPLRDGILPGSVDQFKDGSFDVVSAIDVIEHVEDPIVFLRHCWRVARKGVFLTTPDYDCFHLGNKFHLREYTPGELLELCLRLGGHVETWVANEKWQINAQDGCYCNMGMMIWRCVA